MGVWQRSPQAGIHIPLDTPMDFRLRGRVAVELFSSPLGRCCGHLNPQRDDPLDTVDRHLIKRRRTEQQTGV